MNRQPTPVWKILQEISGSVSYIKFAKALEKLEEGRNMAKFWHAFFERMFDLPYCNIDQSLQDFLSWCYLFVHLTVDVFVLLFANDNIYRFPWNS